MNWKNSCPSGSSPASRTGSCASSRRPASAQAPAAPAPIAPTKNTTSLPSCAGTWRLWHNERSTENRKHRHHRRRRRRVRRGVFAGEGTACDDDPDPCAVPMGACCRPDNTCYEIDATSCAQGGNVYYGDGSYCADTDCGAALPGDECSSAIVATLGANAFDTSNMTPSTPEPDEAMCAGTFLDWMGSPDAWLMFTADSSSTHTFTTCDGASYDTSMVLYEGDCNTQVACNGDSSGGSGCQAYYSAFNYNVTVGEVYYIRLGGWQGISGTGTLTIE